MIWFLLVVWLQFDWDELLMFWFVMLFSFFWFNNELLFLLEDWLFILWLFNDWLFIFFWFDDWELIIFWLDELKLLLLIFDFEEITDCWSSLLFSFSFISFLLTSLLLIILFFKTEIFDNLFNNWFDFY